MELRDDILQRLLLPPRKSQMRDEQLRFSVGPPPLEVPRKETLMGWAMASECSSRRCEHLAATNIPARPRDQRGLTSSRLQLLLDHGSPRS